MTEVTQSGVVREAFGRVLRSTADPYAGADRTNASRIVALLWLLSGLMTFAFLPFDPPTETIGAAGWAAAAAVIVASAAGATYLVRRDLRSASTRCSPSATWGWPRCSSSSG